MSLMSFSIQGYTPQQAMDVIANPKEAKLTTRRTIEELGNQVRTQSSTQVRSKYALKKADFDPYMRFSKPRVDDLRGVIEVQARPIPLMQFGAKQLTSQNRVITRTSGRQLKRAGRMKQGVTYRILRSGPMVNLPKHFIAYSPRSRRLEVFSRKGKDRNDIRSARFISVASAFMTPDVTAANQALVEAKAHEIWQRNWKFYLDRAGKR